MSRILACVISTLPTRKPELRPETERNMQKNVQVTDFVGQVFSMQLPVNFNGQLRVVPTKKNFSSETRSTGCLSRSPARRAENWCGRYSAQRKTFNIYCSDELSARKFLSPRVFDLVWRTHFAKRSLRLSGGNKLYISLYTDTLSSPHLRLLKKLDGLSIEKEYKELRKQLDFLLNFTKVFQS